MSEDKKTIVKMAHIYSQEGRWDKAIAEYKKLIKLDPEDYNSYSMIGDVYVKKGELQPAFDAYLICSDAYIRLGQLEKAGLVQSKIARLASETLNDASKKKQAIFVKQVEGDKAFEAGEIDAAVQSYQSVLELDPDRFDLYQKMGDLLLRKGDTAGACKKYLEIGDIYFRNKLIKKAAPIYLKVVELDPENIDAYAALADIHVKSGNESEAKRELLQLAELLFMRGDLDRSYLFAQKGEQLKSIESYNYLGHVEFRRGKVSEAKAWFEKLLKFKLNHGGALWGMGLVHLQANNDAEALKAFEKVPKNDRFYGEARAAAAEIYAKQGKTPQAAEAFQEAAKLLRDKGRMEESKQAAERAGQLGAGVPEAAAPPPAPAPAPAPSPAPPPAPSPAAPAPSPSPPPAAGLPPLPTVAAAAPSALPPLPTVAAAPVFQASPFEPAAESPVSDDAETLLGLAENFEAEQALDEAIGLYQRVLAQEPANARAKEALARVYGALARGAMGAATPAPAPAEPDHSAEELNRLSQMKAQAETEKQKAEADARRQAEELAKAEAEAKRLAEERAKAEAEARRQIEQKIAVEQEVRAKIEAEAKLRAETEARLRAEITAHQKAQEEAKRQAEEAARQSEDMKKRMETEIRAQLEAEMRKQMEDEARKRADEEVAMKVLEAKRQAEAEARQAAEKEIRRQFEDEKKKLQNENAEVKRRLEEELRQRITSEVQKKESAEATRKVEAVRVKSEDEARKKIQTDVLARVQAQQKEKMAPLQRTIEEIRRKVEEQQAQSQPKPAETKPSAPPKAAPPADEGGDDMDDFMTAAVADIYVKQGLVKEAQRIYERILKREPGNADVRAKLDVLTGAKSAPPKPAPPDGGGPKKTSKVSYL